MTRPLAILSLVLAALLGLAALAGIPKGAPAAEPPSPGPTAGGPRRAVPRASFAKASAWLSRLEAASALFDEAAPPPRSRQPGFAWSRHRSADLSRELAPLEPFFAELEALITDPVGAKALRRGTPFLPPAFGPESAESPTRPKLGRSRDWVTLACARAVHFSRDRATAHLAPRALAHAFDLSVLLDDGSAVAYADRCELETVCLQALETMLAERSILPGRVRTEVEPRLRRAAGVQRVRTGLEYELAAWRAALAGDDGYLDQQAEARARLGFETRPTRPMTPTFLERHEAITSTIDGFCTLWPAPERAAPAETLAHLARQGHWNRTRMELARLALALVTAYERKNAWPKDLGRVERMFEGLVPVPACVHAEFVYRRSPEGVELAWIDTRTPDAGDVLTWSWRGP